MTYEHPEGLGRRRLLGAGAGAVFGTALAAVARPSAATAQSTGAPSEPPPVERVVVSAQGASISGVVALEEEGSAGITSITPRAWQNGVRPMRIRVSRATAAGSGQHFLIVPYEYGVALEYDGVIEVWAQDFSVHNRGGGTMQGAHLWVGNDTDTGGLWATALDFGRRNKYAELAAQTFEFESHGNLRLRVVDRNDFVEIVVGRLGRAPDRVLQIGQIGVSGEAGMFFGDGVDLALYRAQRGHLRCTGRFTAARGLGVGNAEAAADSGRVVGKFEIFDNDGLPLGWVPIFDKL
jgi:hypothetical protein